MIDISNYGTIIRPACCIMIYEPNIFTHESYRTSEYGTKNVKTRNWMTRPIQTPLKTGDELRRFGMLQHIHIGNHLEHNFILPPTFDCPYSDVRYDSCVKMFGSSSLSFVL
jgi:hypothetical protein